MLSEIQLTKMLAKKILVDLEIESPGPVYDALCKISPLQKVGNKTRHKKGLKILTSLANFLQTHEIKADLKKQIHQYMEALGLLLEEYEKAVYQKKMGAKPFEYKPKTARGLAGKITKLKITGDLHQPVLKGFDQW